MSVSRVRENRMHGSMRRREERPDQSGQHVPHGPGTSRRPYKGEASGFNDAHPTNRMPEKKWGPNPLRRDLIWSSFCQVRNANCSR
jgi:hypothetical protein